MDRQGHSIVCNEYIIVLVELLIVQGKCSIVPERHPVIGDESSIGQSEHLTIPKEPNYRVLFFFLLGRTNIL